MVGIGLNRIGIQHREGLVGVLVLRERHLARLGPPGRGLPRPEVSLAPLLGLVVRGVLH